MDISLQMMSKKGLETFQNCCSFCQREHTISVKCIQWSYIHVMFSIYPNHNAPLPVYKQMGNYSYRGTQGVLLPWVLLHFSNHFRWVQNTRFGVQTHTNISYALNPFGGNEIHYNFGIFKTPILCTYMMHLLK